jgi:hypothetical protein
VFKNSTQSLLSLAHVIKFIYNLEDSLVAGLSLKYKTPLIKKNLKLGLQNYAMTITIQNTSNIIITR